MLLIVLICVLVAATALVIAAITSTALWAWLSVATSVVAAVILIADVLRRRSRRRAAAGKSDVSGDDEPGSPAEPAAQPELEANPEPKTEPKTKTEKAADQPATRTSEQTTMMTASGDLAEPVAEGAAKLELEPEQEHTSPEDVAVLRELSAPVVVINERPRYHLTDCVLLGGHQTDAISVSEARGLGFTPCASCEPDRELLGRHRGQDGR